MNRILPQLLANITGHPRQQMISGIDFQWSSELWVHNVFRVYELIFWRRFGIRAEASASQRNGKTIIRCHSWESLLAFTESQIRQAFSFKLRIPVKIYVPILWTPQGIPVFASPYLLAVAYDTSVTMNFVGSTTTNTLSSYVTTGSNLTVFGFVDTEDGTGSDKISGVTWDSNAMSQVTKGSTTIDTGYIYGLNTGVTAKTANLVATASSSLASIGFEAASYSGTAQTDTFNGNTSVQTSTTPSVDVTTTTANSWLVSCGQNQGSGTMTLTSTGTSRQTGGRPWSDTNATVSVGVNTASYSQTLLICTTHACELRVTAAAGGTVSPSQNLLLMGTG